MDGTSTADKVDRIRALIRERIAEVDTEAQQLTEVLALLGFTEEQPQRGKREHLEVAR